MADIVSQRATARETEKVNGEGASDKSGERTETKYQSPISILRHYLTNLTPERLDHLAQLDLVAMRAKIILEFMQEKGIENINEGIRFFTAFERKRLVQLGFLVSPDLKDIRRSF